LASRFAGEERLACNCGAAGCRGFVNEDANVAEEDQEVAPLSKLKPFLA
jgi:hypothetical protein